MKLVTLPHIAILMHLSGGLLTFHRAQFHNVLLKRLSPRCRTYLSKRLHYYTQPLRSGDPVHLVFQDGSTATCDILIGADGLKSAVRASMLHEQARVAEYRGQHAQAADLRTRIEPRWSGVLAYRILVSAEKLRRVSPHHRVLTVPTMVSIIAFAVRRETQLFLCSMLENIGYESISS